MPKVFYLACALAHALGVRSIKDLPACWEHQVDDEWAIAINGRAERAKGLSNAEVPGHSLYVEFNGWPFAVVNAGGGIAGSGVVANEDKLIAALNRAIDAAGGAILAGSEE